MGLLDGKTLLITGVITDASIAFSVARLAQQEGARIVLTGFGRMSLVNRVANKLPDPPPVVELDVANQEHLDSLAERVREHVDSVDGVLHSIGFAPASCLGGDFLATPWDDVATAIQVSAFSLKSLAVAALPLFGESGGALVGLTFDATLRVAGLRLDGRGEGGSRVDGALPRAGARAEEDQREHRCCRADPHDGSEEHPGLRDHSRTPGTAVRRSGGTTRTPSRSPARRSPCSRTGSRRRPAR